MESWFEHEFGFSERSVPCQSVRDAFVLHQHEDNSVELVSRANDRRFFVGVFETPTVTELHRRLTELEPVPDDLGGLTFENVADNARVLHMDGRNEGSVFQVASQFNCLEMVGPGERPENGITQYFRDKTQGPACAMACPAATLFRNYLCPVNRLLDETQPLAWSGQLGGSRRQLDTTRDVGKLVGNEKNAYWEMRNGYLLPKDNLAMRRLAERLKSETVPSATGAAVPLATAATASMRVGVHWSTETATPSNHRSSGKRPISAEEHPPAELSRHRVCQVLCSAVPVAYAKATTSMDWAPFATCVLNAQYEATLAVAAILALRDRRRIKVFLTSVGGGAFGNRSAWIEAAMARALGLFQRFPLDVRLVHYMRVPKADFTALKKQYPARPPAQTVVRAAEGGSAKAVSGGGSQGGGAAAAGQAEPRRTKPRGAHS